MSQRKCAAKCKLQVEAPRLFCEEHWKRVPPEIKAALAEAWADRDKPLFGKHVLVAQGILSRS